MGLRIRRSRDLWYDVWAPLNLLSTNISHRTTSAAGRNQMITFQLQTMPSSLATDQRSSRFPGIHVITSLPVDPRHGFPPMLPWNRLLPLAGRYPQKSTKEWPLFSFPSHRSRRANLLLTTNSLARHLINAKRLAHHPHSLLHRLERQIPLSLMSK